jgi:cysteine sulfinate desulfinase/cysteine desulfurase-like protein
VLKAMKVPVRYAVGTVRLSTGKYTTKEEVLKAAEVIQQKYNQLSQGELAVQCEH